MLSSQYNQIKRRLEALSMSLECIKEDIQNNGGLDDETTQEELNNNLQQISDSIDESIECLCVDESLLTSKIQNED